MGFWETIDAIFLQEGQTDRYSPGNDILMDRIRFQFESLFMLLLDTGDSGSATSDPSETVLTDTGASYDVDEHNGRTLLITSGAAKGNKYTIDDTTATTLTCTGDTLYSDGVRSGDTYKILYDVKANADGHDHDGINSAPVVLQDSQVTQAKLATTSSSVNDAGTGSWVDKTLPGGQYGFYPRIYMSGAGSVNCGAAILHEESRTTWTSAVTVISLIITTYTIYAVQRYVTSSGEIHWVFVLRDKATKKIKSIWEAPDHPCMGNGGDPNILPHPFLTFDEANEEIFVVTFEPDDPILEAIKQASSHKRCRADVIMTEYELDESEEPEWPTKAVTVGLPEDWEEAWLEREPVEPIKITIPKPSMVQTARLKLKET